MEKFSCFVLFFVAVMASSFHTASAIRCYVCNSHFDGECGFKGAKLNERYLQDCDYNSTICRKLIQTVPYQQNEMGPDNRIIRECGHDQRNEKGYYFVSGFGGLQEVYGCQEDGCNSAISHPLSLFLALATFALLFSRSILESF